MKKDFLKFPQKRISFLPKVESRRFPHLVYHGATSYKSDGDDPDAKTKEAEFLKKIDDKIQAALATRATKDEIKAIQATMPEAFKDFPVEALRKIADEKEGVMKIVTDQGLELQRLKNRKDEEKPKDLSLRGQIKAWHDSPNEPEYNEDGTEKRDAVKRTVIQTIKDLKIKKRADLRPFELEFSKPDIAVDLSLRAVQSPMLPAGTLGSSAYLPIPQFLPGIVDVIRPTYTFWDTVKKGGSSSAVLVWINKKVPAGLGAAAWIAPGVYKPGISFTVNTQTSNAKKIAANEKVAVELLDDIEGFATWMTDELLYQVYQKASLTLMSGVADTETPAGIQTLSVANAFAALGLKTDNPNNWDVIRSAVAQFRAANFTGYNVTTFVNPIDAANMVMTKANNQGQTFIPPATGSAIIEDNNLPVGYFQSALMDLYKISIYKGFSMMWGLENDDFTKNLRTVIGEMRLHQYFSENHVGAFIYDTFANGITGLTTP